MMKMIYLFNIFTVTLNHPPPPPNKNFDRTPPCFHPGLDIGLPSMLDHFHKSGVVINPVFHAGSCAYKIETFAFRKRTKTETATCLLVMIFTKGPGPQSFKSARVFQQPSEFGFPVSASVQILLPSYMHSAIFSA